MPRSAPDQRTSELKRLAVELERHDSLYYAKATQEISDAEYDDLKDRYERLADELEIPADERHQRTPGDDHVEGFQTVRHDQPMLSLEKANTEADAFVVAGEDVPPERLAGLDEAVRKRTAWAKLSPNRS